MPEHKLPKYPVYVISKGRADCCLTANFLIRDKVPFHIVVEPQEFDQYAEKYGADRLYVLPFSNLGLGSIPARNWVWDHAKEAGHERHWILDDNIRYLMRKYKNKRIPCRAGIALYASEVFFDRYENIAIGGLNYVMFAPEHIKQGPFVKNAHVYSCLCILNKVPYRWRGRYNEDTDLCLQVLSGGWCTVSLNAFLCHKMQTMKFKGGNTDHLYASDGRAHMARALERMWPGVVETKRRFQRPQHVVKYAWGRFDNKLILKPGIKLDELPPVDEFGMEVKQVKEIKSKRVQALIDGSTKVHGW